ncbi:MAG TPA: tripartite tricarboxylate transporter TctB family protein [Casimicrobiaceae bacterium]|jgi:hypothetical protein
MRSRNLVVGLVCLAISVWLLLLTRGLPPAIMVPVGPAFYPRVVLSFMALLSVLLIAIELVAYRRASPPAEAAATTPKASYLLVLATFVAFTLYVLLLPRLGFRIATVLFVAGLQVALSWPRTASRWVVVVLVALGTAVVCDLVFERYLSVLLPRGDWTGL